MGRRTKVTQEEVRKALAKKGTSMEALTLTIPCKKCSRSNGWQPEAEPLTWSCYYCGNMAYFTYGTLKQQIELVMASERKEEFINTDIGVLPKKGDDVRRARFLQKTTRGN